MSIFSSCLDLDNKRHYFGLHISKAIDRFITFHIEHFFGGEQVRLDQLHAIHSL